MKAVWLVSLVLVGCASSSGVQKVGPDTYTVSSATDGYTGREAGARKRALEEANAHCAGMGREIMVTSLNAAGTWNRGNAAVTFRCLAKGDPDLHRPDLEPAPTAVIQTR